jgi:hypothetical protein
VNPAPKPQKHPEYLQLAYRSFCDRYGVHAPHEAVDRNLTTILEWCQCVDHFRHFAPPSALKEATRV